MALLILVLFGLLSEAIAVTLVKLAFSGFTLAWSINHHRRFSIPQTIETWWSLWGFSNELFFFALRLKFWVAISCFTLLWFVWFVRDGFDGSLFFHLRRFQLKLLWASKLSLSQERCLLLPQLIIIVVELLLVLLDSWVATFARWRRILTDCVGRQSVHLSL